MRTLRFLLILPAAIVTALVVLFPIHWITLLLMHENGFLHFMSAQTLEQLLCSALVPPAFIAGGAFTSPGYRFQIALLLAALVVVGALIGLVMVHSGGYNVEFEDPPALIIVKGVLVLAGVIFGVLSARRAEHLVQAPVEGADTLERARRIVAHGEAEFASGRKIDDAFVPFAEGGAASRHEARNALLVVIADFYRHATLSGSVEELDLYRDYVRSSRFIATRIACDALVSPAEVASCAMRAGTDYESFAAFLTTLDPSQRDYWPSVFAHLPAG